MCIHIFERDKIFTIECVHKIIKKKITYNQLWAAIWLLKKVGTNRRKPNKLKQIIIVLKNMYNISNSGKYVYTHISEK